MCKKALNLLAIAQKGGNIAIGEEPVGAAAQRGKARLIILASDAAGHTQRRAQSFGARHNTPLVSIDADKQTLGGMFGHGTVAMAALTDINLSKAFLEALGQPERYGETLQKVSDKAAVMARRKRERGRKGQRGTR